MAARTRTIVGLALGLGSAVSLAAPVFAATIPQAVSPGLDDGVGRVPSLCPTFSWAGVEDALAYELVIYDAGSGVEGAGVQAAAARVPGPASSWTPSLGQCLESGRRYVWFVRGVGENGIGAWSEGRVFDIVAAPTIAEVEQALAILRRYLESGGPATDAGPPELASNEGHRAVESSSETDETEADAHGGFAAAAEVSGSGVEIAESAITIAGLEVVTTASDQDTLAGMTCGDGQLAKWNGDLSTWECGDDVGGTEYLPGNQLSLDSGTFNVEEGPGSDLDADTLDGLDATQFAKLELANSFAGSVSAPSFHAAGNVTATGVISGTSVAATEGVFTSTKGGEASLRVENTSTEGLSTGLYGVASGETGFTTFGVWGETASTWGRGVLGLATAPSGPAFGVQGNSDSEDGAGVFGWARATTGDAIGVGGTTESTLGAGGRFHNRAGGKILVGWTGSSASEVFSVAGDGTVTATSYVGDGSGLTEVTAADSDTLDGLEGTEFARLGIDNVFTGDLGAKRGTFSDAVAGATLTGTNSSAAADAIGVHGHSSGSGGAGVLGSGFSGVRGETNEVGGFGLFGISSADGTAYGVWGEVTSTTAGSAYGVLGTSASSGGSSYGVVGLATASTGTTTGVSGRSDSNEGTGVSGFAAGSQSTGVFGAAPWKGVEGKSTAPSGLAYGVRAEAASVLGRAVFGLATALTGGAYGVYGESASSSGRGVYGVAGNPSGYTVGVYGSAASPQGTGVYGSASAGSGMARGVYGESASSSGAGLYGHSSSASGSPHGVHGEAVSPDGVGVFGKATAYGGPNDEPVGVSGESAGYRGIGVKGVATADSNESVGVLGLSPFIGVKGSSTGSFGAGVWARASGEGGQAVNAFASAGEAVSASVSAANTAAIETNAYGVSGTGVEGYASHLTSATTGILGTVRSSSGTAGKFVSESESGTILSGRSGSSEAEVMRVEGSGRLAVLGSSGTNAASFIKGTGTAGTAAAVEVVNGASYGEAGWFRLMDPANTLPVVKLVLEQSASSNYLVCDEMQTAGGVSRKCHIDNNGTYHAGSDFAEALPALGERATYEPGDVLLMADDGSGVEKVAEPYSPRVAGVYSTRPGILGADKGGETRVDENDVPVAIVGIVPTKVSGENGSIAVGDLLVTSGLSGHAMKGTDRTRMQGAIVGKALEPFFGKTGVIRVLVSLL